MPDPVTTIAGYADLVTDTRLDGRDVDVLARELQDRAGDADALVAWLPEWLLAEKDIEPVERSAHIISGRITHETERAYLVRSGRTEAWLPKSFIRVYRCRPGAELSIPQRGLTDYVTEGGEEA